MSCEGNRKRFFDVLQARCGLDATTLEKVYQAGRNQPRDPDEATEKTRLLFDDLRLLGMKPPTHSPDGLPNAAGRQGYAAVFDYIRARIPGALLDWEDLGLEKPDTYPYEWKAWPLDIRSVSFLDERMINVVGRGYHRFLEDDRHVWWGKCTGNRPPYTLAPSRPIRPEEKRVIDDFLARRDASGLYPDGRDEFGFDPDGWDELGYNLYGLRKRDLTNPSLVEKAARKVCTLSIEKSGGKRGTVRKSYDVDVEGFDETGFSPLPGGARWDDVDRLGFNRAGFRQGRSWTGYDENGLDANGNPYPKRRGYDAWGYEKKTGLTAPDAQGRRYNLIGWVYDPQTDECYNPDNPQQRMKHSDSFYYSAKWKKVVLKRSYVPSDQEMVARIKDPRIRMQEIRKGGYRGLVYGLLVNQKGLSDQQRSQLLWWNLPETRALRTPERAQANSEATFAGVRLRCPRCGQFTGARPHRCPHFGKKVLIYDDGTVVSLETGSIFDQIEGDYPHSPIDAVDEIANALNDRFWCGHVYIPDPLAKWAGVQQAVCQRIAHDPEQSLNCDTVGPFEVQAGDLLAQVWKQDGETGIVTEAPNSPLGEDFDPDFDGSPLSGLHWKTGLSRDGYSPSGIHYLTGRTRDGKDIAALKRMARIKKSLKDTIEEMGDDPEAYRRLLERTYSRIATSLAGEPRRVDIENQGGPRPGMFWTDMRGHIQAEMEPLRHTPRNSPENNLLALKAGIYHELGHEEDTPVGVFRRIVDIAQGKERVDGIPPEQAGIVSEIYNILEDGRMERTQAKRRRGVAAVLAADAMINPRWDEQVGETVPMMHQIMGLMLYRSLPFFRVRQEVLDRAPERVRRLYAEIEPLVDAAMRSPEDAFRATIEITRRLTQEPEIAQAAANITAKQLTDGEWARSGNGGYGVIVSALPRPKEGEADATIAVPQPGWRGEDDIPGGRARSGSAEEELRKGRRRGRKPDEDDAQGGRPRAGRTEDEQRKGQQRARKPDEDGQGGRPTGLPVEQPSDGAGSLGSGGAITPEPDQAFLDSLMETLDITEVVSSVVFDMETGKRVPPNAVGEEMQRPLSGSGVRLPVADTTLSIKPLIGLDRELSPSRKRKLRQIVQAAEREARPLAQRLQRLKAAILKRERFQTSGRADRKRFKRALSGARTVYQTQRAADVTSLAVSIQVDMSGSMNTFVRSGQLASTAATIGKALEMLGAQYTISAFGGRTALVKTFGDPAIREEQLYGLMSMDLGGTVAQPGLSLGLHALKGAAASNKLHFLLTDGDLHDHNHSKQVIADMRANGIIPFGIYFGAYAPRERMDDLFGEGNWAHIRQLSDLSNVVARRIERIYRRILATR